MWLFNFQIASFFIAIIVSDVLCAPPEKIVGGLIARPDEFPYQVSLRFNGLHFCGGSIISTTHILTAAHCFENITEPHLYKKVEVVSGTNNLESGGNFHKIKTIKIHPKFVFPSETNDFANDITIITLEKPIQFDDHQKSIKLSTKSDYGGFEAIASGWGRTIKNVKKSSPILMKLTTKIYSGAQCRKISSQICTYSSANSGLCNGDSGGPLVVEDELVGITSHGRKDACASGYMDGFTKVFSFRNFIKEVIENKESPPVYPSPDVSPDNYPHHHFHHNSSPDNFPNNYPHHHFHHNSPPVNPSSDNFPNNYPHHHFHHNTPPVNPSQVVSPNHYPHYHLHNTEQPRGKGGYYRRRNHLYYMEA